MSVAQKSRCINTLKKEHEQLKSTQKSLLYQINKYSKRSFSVHNIAGYVEDLKRNAEFISKREYLTLKFLDATERKKKLNLVVSEVNCKSITKQEHKFVKEICKSTSSLATDQSKQLKFLVEDDLDQVSVNSIKYSKDLSLTKTNNSRRDNTCLLYTSDAADE